MARLVTVATWSGVAVLGGWLAVRLLGLERGFPLVPLLAYTPYAGALALVVLAVAAAARRWVAAVAAAAVVAAFAVVVVPRAVGSLGTASASASPSAAGELRVLTANLQYGEASPDELVELVRRLDVDVVAVQELTTGAVDSLNRAGLEDLLPYEVLAPRPGPAGAGLYARYPMRALPEHAPSGSFAMPAAAVRLPSGPVGVTAVHPVPPVSADAVRRWGRGLGSLPPAGGEGPWILAGDFNATLDHAALREILAAGYQDAAAAVGQGFAPTWPVGLPLPPVTIDHVLVERGCGVGDVSVHDITGSDHRAVLAEVHDCFR